MDQGVPTQTDTETPAPSGVCPHNDAQWRWSNQWANGRWGLGRRYQGTYGNMLHTWKLGSVFTEAEKVNQTGEGFIFFSVENSQHSREPTPRIGWPFHFDHSIEGDTPASSWLKLPRQMSSIPGKWTGYLCQIPSQWEYHITFQFTFLILGKGLVLYQSGQDLPQMNNMLLKGLRERGMVRSEGITL